MFAPDFPYAEVMTAADSAHLLWSYYNGVFATGGALTVREKALIGLALAHAHQCPYCIDSFTATCATQGVTPDQMHEAVHTSAALAAGVHLVHAVQMRNTLTRHAVL